MDDFELTHKALGFLAFETLEIQVNQKDSFEI